MQGSELAIKDERVANDEETRELSLPILSEADLLAARRRARNLASEIGFSMTEAVGIVAVVSELSRNILMYAGKGMLTMRTISGARRHGMEIVACDDGPGIQDINKALLDGFSTSGGLGYGLPGVRRLVDEFDLDSEPGKGTTVTVRKWLHH